MLLWKKQEPVQSTVAHAATLGPETASLLQPERSNEDLLTELQELAAVHRRGWRSVVSLYVGAIVLYVAALLATVVTFSRLPQANMGPFLAWLAAEVGLVAAGLFSALYVGRSFYKHNRERLASTVSTLAQRGEVRAVQDLLCLMEMRTSGVTMWQESRPVFVQALEALFARITPDHFEELLPKQTWDIGLLLYLPDGNLRQVTSDMLIRCGDSRTIESLRKLLLLCKAGQTNMNHPLVRWNPMMRLMQAQGVPFATPDVTAAIDRCIAAITVRMDETRRNAELLRASAPNREQAASELMRAAGPVGAATAPEELVRASADAGQGDPPRS
jgi:hypothetical protein